MIITSNVLVSPDALDSHFHGQRTSAVHGPRTGSPTVLYHVKFLLLVETIHHQMVQFSRVGVMVGLRIRIRFSFSGANLQEPARTWNQLPAMCRFPRLFAVLVQALAQGPSVPVLVAAVSFAIVRHRCNCFRDGKGLQSPPGWKSMFLQLINGRKRRYKQKRHLILRLECGPMPNLMVALPNIGGALCSTLQSLADAHY